MSEIKYQHAYIDRDENKIISINDLTKENSKLHEYRCIGCGNILLPRAIGSKYKKPHFYHKELVNCSGETYLHKLAKKVIKDKFDNNENFYIEYNITKSCGNKDCKYKNPYCPTHETRYKKDLKEYYDTCTIEAPVNGFVADILLTDSTHPDREPILIEICVTHKCEKEKIESGLQIIEIVVKEEQDIFQLKACNSIMEAYTLRNEKIVNFISFKKELEEPMHTKIQRYVYNPKQNPIGYLTEIDCKKANIKLRTDSLFEYNVYSNNYSKCELNDCLYWMVKNKGLRRCIMCKFHYATTYEDYPMCRLSKKYGKPKYPSMDEAERCNSYSFDKGLGSFFNDLFTFEEVAPSSLPMKPEYKVIIAVSKSFREYMFIKNKCQYYLSEKMKTHTIVILTGASKLSDEFIRKLSNDMDFITEPHETNWNKYGQEAAISKSNEEMTSNADALIAFWDGSTGIKDMIDHARQKKIKVAIVDYKK